MADPLSIVASIVTVAGAGMKLTSALYTLVDCIRNANVKIELMTIEITTLSCTLDEVHDIVERCHELYSTSLMLNLKKLLETCTRIYSDIEKILKIGRSGKTFRLTENLKWPLHRERIRPMRVSLESLKTTLLVMLQTMKLAEIKGQIHEKVTPSHKTPDGACPSPKDDRELQKLQRSERQTRQRAEALVVSNYWAISRAQEATQIATTKGLITQGPDSESSISMETNLWLWQIVPYKPRDRHHRDTQQPAMELISPGQHLAGESLPARASETVDQLMKNWTNDFPREEAGDLPTKEEPESIQPQNIRDFDMGSETKGAWTFYPDGSYERRKGLGSERPKKQRGVTIPIDRQAHKESSSDTESFKSTAGPHASNTSSPALDAKVENLEESEKDLNSRTENDGERHAAFQLDSTTTHSHSRTASKGTSSPHSPHVVTSGVASSPVRDPIAIAKRLDTMHRNVGRNPVDKKPKSTVQFPLEKSRHTNLRKEKRLAREVDYSKQDKIPSHPPTMMPSTGVPNATRTTPDQPYRLGPAPYENPHMPSYLHYPAIPSAPPHAPDVGPDPKLREHNDRFERLEKLILDYQQEQATKEAGDNKKKAENVAEFSAREMLLSKREQAVEQAEDVAKRLKDKKQVLTITDVIGRQFIFPFLACRTWEGIYSLICSAFEHIDRLGPHVAEGHYDLLGLSGEVILPSTWETIIEPGWSLSMKMFPMVDLENPVTAPSAPYPTGKIGRNMPSPTSSRKMPWTRGKSKERVSEDRAVGVLPPEPPAKASKPIFTREEAFDAETSSISCNETSDVGRSDFMRQLEETELSDLQQWVDNKKRALDGRKTQLQPYDMTPSFHTSASGTISPLQPASVPRRLVQNSEYNQPASPTPTMSTEEHLVRVERLLLESKHDQEQKIALKHKSDGQARIDELHRQIAEKQAELDVREAEVKIHSDEEKFARIERLIMDRKESSVAPLLLTAPASRPESSTSGRRSWRHRIFRRGS